MSQASAGSDAPLRLLETAREAAQAAANVHRKATGRKNQRWVESKTAASDFVCDVDLAAQEAALSVVAARHPDHEIMAEERGGERPGTPDNEHVWLVDPLDGTTNFLHGHPYHSASVAVWDGAGPVAGAVHAQALGAVWTAARGEGAFENGRRVRASPATDVSGFLLGTGFPFKFPELVEPYLGTLATALRRTSGVRRTGASTLDFAYVANGTLDAYWEPVLEPWDFGAGVLLVTEAGGRVGRIEGGPVLPVRGSILAANSAPSLAALQSMLSAP